MPRPESGRRRGRPGGPSDSRSASRPAAARRPAPQGAAKRTRAPREGGMTGRATALLVILAALALGYAYPVREYFEQRAEIEALAQAQAEQRRRIAALEEEEAKWHDDRYLEIQVRSRLYWVRKGEIPLIPIWEDEVDTGPPPPSPPPKTWYESLWSGLDTHG
jgi:cell division protein FtsB